MGKITLAGKEYDLPELTFGVAREISNNGFNILMPSDETKLLACISACVAVITHTSLKEADKIIDQSYSCDEELVEIIDTINKWITESDFFRKMQAKKK